MLNRVILIGRPTKDPELRYTPAGVAVAQYVLAVDRPFTSQGGEREADFIPVVVWRQLGETAANYGRKGLLQAVEGRIQVRNYDNNEGKRVYVTEVVADSIRFIQWPDRGEGGQGGSGAAGGQGSGSGSGSSSGQGGSRSQGSGGYDPFVDDGKPVDISDDDLPF